MELSKLKALFPDVEIFSQVWFEEPSYERTGFEKKHFHGKDISKFYFPLEMIK